MALSQYNPGIQFKDASFGWNANKKIFYKLNFTLELNCFVLLTGENAIGKSTLASLTAGIIKPSNGEVLLNDKPFSTKHDISPYQQISYLQQTISNNLIGVNAAEDLKLWQIGQSANKQSNEQTQASLEYWGLADIQHRPVWELSAGELKRLCLAGISIFPKRYWILDEPDSALDNQYLLKLIETLRLKHEAGSGALIISHNLSAFKDICDEHWKLTPNLVSQIERER